MLVAETDTHRFPQVPGSLPLDLFPLNLFVFVVLVVGQTTMNQTRFQSHALPLYGSRSGPLHTIERHADPWQGDGVKKGTAGAVPELHKSQL